MKILDIVKPGVVTGDDLQKVFHAAKNAEFAIPAVNVVGTNSVNAVIETARVVNSPAIIQLSNGGAVFYGGKGNPLEGQKPAIIGGISAAKHVHLLAEAYGVPIILHTDHAAKNYYHGLMDFSMLAKSISSNLANHCLARTCSIYRKSPFMRTSKFAKNTSKE